MIHLKYFIIGVLCVGTVVGSLVAAATWIEVAWAFLLLSSFAASYFVGYAAINIYKELGGRRYK